MMMDNDIEAFIKFLTHFQTGLYFLKVTTFHIQTFLDVLIKYIYSQTPWTRSALSTDVSRGRQCTTRQLLSLQDSVDRKFAAYRPNHIDGQKRYRFLQQRP